jgi:hypothetical protein
VIGLVTLARQMAAIVIGSLQPLSIKLTPHVPVLLDG